MAKFGKMSESTFKKPNAVSLGPQGFERLFGKMKIESALLFKFSNVNIYKQ